MRFLILLTPQQAWAILKYLIPSFLIVVVVVSVYAHKEQTKRDQLQRAYQAQKAHDQEAEEHRLTAEKAATEIAKQELMPGVQTVEKKPEYTQSIAGPKLKTPKETSLAEDLHLGQLLAYASLWGAPSSKKSEANAEALAVMDKVKLHPKTDDDFKSSVRIKTDQFGKIEASLSSDFRDLVLRAKNIPEETRKRFLSPYLTGEFPEEKTLRIQIKAYHEILRAQVNDDEKKRGQGQLANSIKNILRKNPDAKLEDVANATRDKLGHNIWKKAEPLLTEDQFLEFVLLAMQ